MNSQDNSFSNTRYGSKSDDWVSLGTEGEQGSEGGRIIADEEYADACRITLEKECPIEPYGITCSIYGLMVHTTWASTLAEAMNKYEGTKKELADFVETYADEESLYGAWCSDFVGRWM